jgi:CRISPR/Cas system-associated protein Cas10 (large subunit of type III CRISPR-Cas system)
MKKKKMCAVCGDKTQSNVVFLFKRYSDDVTFNVCALCAEHGFDAQDLKMITKKTLTTVHER